MTPAARLHVQGATAYPLSVASARVRVANHIPFVREHGIDLSHAPTLLDTEYALLASSAHPLKKSAVLARSAARAAKLQRPGGLHLVHRLLTLTPLPGVDPPRHLDVYDFDDALLVGSAAASNRRFQWTKQEARRTLACIRRARVVIAANQTLAGHAHRIGARVEVVPSCVDPSTQPLHEHLHDGPTILGWIGSHTTVGYLQPVMPVIERLCDHGRTARLVVVGGDTGVRANWIEHRPWSLETQAAELASFDVGLMPLPDTDWTRGKSGYKLLQYFAAGVPAVGSPVGLNAELLSEGRGLPATSDTSWDRALRDLLDDAVARCERGRAARKFVEAHYSYQRWAPQLASLLQSLG